MGRRLRGIAGGSEGSWIAVFRMTFTFRLILLATVSVAVAVALNASSVYQSTYQALQRRLAAELLAVVNSGAPMIDGDLHEMIYARSDRSIGGFEEFEILREQLLKIREVTGHEGPEAPLYTMRASADFAKHGWLEFVVMTERDESGNYFVGNRYPAEFHNRAALRGASMASELYEDGEGSWISASAPIRNSEGEIVGLLQADRSAQSLRTEAREEVLAVLRFGALAVALAAGLAGLVARSLSRPINELVHAINDFGAGDFSRRVYVSRRDELGELAESFNLMAQHVAAQSMRADFAREEAHAKVEMKGELLSHMATWVQRPLEQIAQLADRLSEAALSVEEADAVSRIREEAEKSLVLVAEIGQEEAKPATRLRPRASATPMAAMWSDEAEADPPTAEWADGDEEVSAETWPAAAASRVASDHFELRVLLAEDNAELQRSTEQLLSDLGCSVTCVATGSAAVECCMRDDYDLILMDYQMPGMDGVEASRRIRAHESGARRVPILALLGRLDEARVQRCREAGMDELLEKPLSRAALIGRLHAIASAPSA